MDAKELAQTPINISKLLEEVKPPELREVVKKAYLGVEDKIVEAEKKILDTMPRTMSKGDRTAVSNMIRIEAFKNVVEKVLQMLIEHQERNNKSKGEPNV